MLTDPYAPGALLPEYHDRLVADLENFALDAGIMPKWIINPLPPEVGAGEREFLKNFHRHASEGIVGLCYTAKAKIPLIDHRMSMLAGCLVRNFVRARVMTLGAVLDHLAAKTLPELTCILIPNFFLTEAEGGKIATWQISALHDFLVDRQVRGQQTILFVSDLNLLGKEYGLALQSLIRSNFQIVGG